MGVVCEHPLSRYSPRRLPQYTPRPRIYVLGLLSGLFETATHTNHPTQSVFGTLDAIQRTSTSLPRSIYLEH